MKQTKSDLAKSSWREAFAHYLHVKKITGIYFSDMCAVIKLIQQNKLDDILFASISHERLVVSTQHRYDANVDTVIINCEESGFVIEHFSKKSKIMRPEITKVNTNLGAEFILTYIKKVLLVRP